MFASTAGSRASSVVGVARRMKLSPARQRRQAELLVLLRRQIDDDQPVDAGRLRVDEEALDAIDVDRIVIAHQHDRRRVVALREIRATSASVLLSVCPAFSARRPAAWIAGPSAIGSVNGMPSSITSAPAAGSAFTIASEVAGVGIAGHDEGHQRGAARVARGRRSGRRCGSS